METGWRLSLFSVNNSPLNINISSTSSSLSPLSQRFEVSHLCPKLALDKTPSMHTPTVLKLLLTASIHLFFQFSTSSISFNIFTAFDFPRFITRSNYLPNMSVLTIYVFHKNNYHTEGPPKQIWSSYTYDSHRDSVRGP